MTGEVEPTIGQKLAAEIIGCFFLFGGVIGSGIMAANLAGENAATALLANTIAVGAILYVLIAMLAPVSGAHFNPAVTLAFWLRKEIDARTSILFVAAQLVGGTLGAFAAHVMFELPVLQVAATTRTGIGQWLGELIATYGLVLTVLMLVRYRPEAIPAAVGLYISSAIWFTSSTSFANPAITMVRSFTDTYTGIAPNDVPLFVIAQFTGAMLAVGCARALGAGRS